MTDTDKRIAQIGVLPVIQLNDPEENAAPLAEALCEGGLPAAEVTFRAPRAEAAIRAMKAACPHMLVGAGTVLTKKQADQAMEAGAQFIVLPGFEGELVAYCQKKNIPVYPGSNTMFIGQVERVGHFNEMCRMCGDCVLGQTGAICPVTKCAKSLVNGPCGGAKNGKCEVNPENDCAWIMIYKKLESMNQLDKLAVDIEDKDYDGKSWPRTVEVK